METLLAQSDPVAVESVASGLFKLVAEYGPSGAFFAILAWLLIKYGPSIVEAHLGFVGDTRKTQQQIADSLTTLTETHATEVKGHSRTHKALGHMAEGHKKQATDADAKAHFERAIDALE